MSKTVCSKPPIPTYNSCFVPKCMNTTLRTPHKVFIPVPKDPTVRKQWCDAAGYPFEHLRASAYICEDHFNLDEDMLYYSYSGKIEGSKIMKKRVVPRFFDCQQPVPLIPMVSSESLTEKVPNPGEIFVCGTSTIENVEFILPDTEETGFEETTSSIDPLSITTSQPLPSRMTRGTQSSRPSISTKSIEAKPLFKDAWTSMEPMDLNVGSIDVPWNDDLIPKMETEDNEEDLRTEAILYPFNDQTVQTKRESTNCNSIGDHARLEILQQIIYETTTRLLIQRDPMTFIGLPQINSSLIGELSIYTQLSKKNIHMILLKIRQDIPNTALAAYFGTDEATVVATVNDGLPKIANCLGHCIAWKKGIETKLDLPPKSRLQYGRLESIVDILDIQVEYPGVPVRQITRENGRRYLISITPDGIVNYVSSGWAGTVSDKHIYENANYIEIVPEGVCILAERHVGLFKMHVKRKQCNMIIPPIRLADPKIDVLTKENTILVDSVRHYVHKKIRGIRDFRLLENHSKIDEQSFALLDNAVIIAAALHNLKIKSLE